MKTFMLKKALFVILVATGIIYFSPGNLLAERFERQYISPDLPQLEPITKEDRVLILAPHPDDESLGTGGIIQRALKTGADIKVLYLTNGEHNQFAFVVHEKRLVIKQSALIKMGEMRQAEAKAAMKFLGVPEEKLIFLGYPDYGTLAIFLKYWEETRPFKDMLTRISKVPYEDALSPNALYKGEAILSDMESVLRQYKPTKIFVTNPVDTNRDHRALYLFLQVALWSTEKDIPAPKVYPYVIHSYNWPIPHNYHPELFVSIPKSLKDSNIRWISHKLSNDEVEKKYEAICMYKSQCAVSAFYLKSFARRNELFGEYPPLELANMEGIPEKSRFKVAATFGGRTIAYGRLNGDLVVNMFIKENSGKARGFYVNLAGYNPDIDFSQMPKIRVDVHEDSMSVLDRGKPLDSTEVTVENKENSITVKIPLKTLGNPKQILASVNTYTANFSSDLNAWRVIKLE